MSPLCRGAVDEGDLCVYSKSLTSRTAVRRIHSALAWWSDPSDGTAEARHGWRIGCLLHQKGRRLLACKARTGRIGAPINRYSLTSLPWRGGVRIPWEEAEQLKTKLDGGIRASVQSNDGRTTYTHIHLRLNPTLDFFTVCMLETFYKVEKPLLEVTDRQYHSFHVAQMNLIDCCVTIFTCMMKNLTVLPWYILSGLTHSQNFTLYLYVTHVERLFLSFLSYWKI